MKRILLELLAMPGLCFSQPVEKWMQKSVRAWPQIALVNDVPFFILSTLLKITIPMFI